MDCRKKGDTVIAKRNTEEEDKTRIGPVKGDFIPPPVLEDQDERVDALPPQEEFWKPPTRFVSSPMLIFRKSPK